MAEELRLQQKLGKIQQELKVPKGQKNDFAGFQYRNLEDIEDKVKPLLKELDLTLVFSDEMIEVGGRVYVKATATLADFEGGSIFNEAYAREAEVKKGMDDAQITGAASSYARKYAASGLFLIDNTKDADSQDNSKAAPKKTVPAMPPANDAKVRPTQLKELDDLLLAKGVAEDKRRKAIEGIIGEGKSARDLTFLEAVKLIDDIREADEDTLKSLSNGAPF